MIPIRRMLSIFTMLAFVGGCALQADRATASRKDTTSFGAMVMAHGGSQKWNDTVLASVASLRERYPVEVAFGMADAASLQKSVERLEAQGVRNIAVVRLFVSGESWYERTEQILGIAPGAPKRPAPANLAHADHAEHAGHSMEFWTIDAHSRFALSKEGLADAPEMAAVLAQRAKSLSRTPESEDVLILAHGPGDDAENERWIARITERAMEVKRERPFRRVEVQTLREDWPDKRAAAEKRIRAFVQRASDERGKAIVIPFRVEGFGPYARVLEGLDYASDGIGLLPHPNVAVWIERQVVELRPQFQTRR